MTIQIHTYSTRTRIRIPEIQIASSGCHICIQSEQILGRSIFFCLVLYILGCLLNTVKRLWNCSLIICYGYRFRRNVVGSLHKI